MSRKEDVEALAKSVRLAVSNMLFAEGSGAIDEEAGEQFHSSLDRLVAEVVRLSGELERLREDNERLTACVGLLPKKWFDQFWFNYDTHPALSAGAEQEVEE